MVKTAASTFMLFNSWLQQTFTPAKQAELRIYIFMKNIYSILQMKNPVVDITNCDREPIHIPGQIQGHGFLVAVDTEDFSIQYISENLLKKQAWRLRLAGKEPLKPVWR